MMMQNISKDNLIFYLVKLTLFFFVFNVHADTLTQTHERIKQFVMSQSHLEADEELNIQVLQSDSHFNGLTCQDNIAFSFAKNGMAIQNNTIQISCPSAPQWNLFVPVKIEVLKPVLSGSHYMPSGTMIQDSDLAYSKQDKKRLPEGFYLEPADIIGLSTLHAISPGNAYTPKNVKQRRLVERNHTIKLEINQGGVKVEMMGIAKSNGALNETIKIMNPSSKKIIYGVVTGKDRVEIATN